ncbi:MAG: protein serine/threonine phosphatase 2C family protein [Phycisphaerales bacterium]|nr:protein serine/threonine phosphatase 2C family protein [Phycisphaerales bacterium]
MPNGCSRQGLRPNLEDTWIAVQHQTPDGLVTLLGVFDGVGGGEEGELASAAAARSIAESFGGVGMRSIIHDRSWMYGAFFNAGLGVQLACTGATTGVVALVRDRHVLIGWVGDSRACCVSADRCGLRWLTEDHHGVSETGVPALTRWLGAAGSDPYSMHTAELAELTLQPGELLMLTTDGVHGTLSDEELLMIVRGCQVSSPRSNAARVLCDAAIAMGSTDNCTSLLLATEAGNDRTEEAAHG